MDERRAGEEGVFSPTESGFFESGGTAPATAPKEHKESPVDDVVLTAVQDLRGYVKKRDGLRSLLVVMFLVLCAATAFGIFLAGKDKNSPLVQITEVGLDRSEMERLEQNLLGRLDQVYAAMESRAPVSASAPVVAPAADSSEVANLNGEIGRLNAALESLKKASELESSQLDAARNEIISLKRKLASRGGPVSGNVDCRQASVRRRPDGKFIFDGCTIR